MTTPPKAFLVNLSSNRRIPLVENVYSLGRNEENDIVISDDTAISGKHFHILLQNSSFFIEDVGSKNGTFVNGQRLAEKAELRDGDAVKVGNTLFWFVLETD